jgi:hypothetical protein
MTKAHSSVQLFVKKIAHEILAISQVVLIVKWPSKCALGIRVATNDRILCDPGIWRSDNPCPFLEAPDAAAHFAELPLPF